MPRTGAIPALSGSSLPFAEELHPPASRPRLQGLWVPLYSRSSCGFDTWFCRCENDARAAGQSLALHSNSHEKHGFGSSRQNLRTSFVVSQLALPPSCRPWCRLPLVVVRSNTGLLLGGVRDDWLALQTATGQPRARDLDPTPARRWCRGPIPPRCYQTQQIPLLHPSLSDYRSVTNTSCHDGVHVSARE